MSRITRTTCVDRRVHGLFKDLKARHQCVKTCLLWVNSFFTPYLNHLPKLHIFSLVSTMHEWIHVYSLQQRLCPVGFAETTVFNLSFRQYLLISHKWLTFNRMVQPNRWLNSLLTLISCVPVFDWSLQQCNLIFRSQFCCPVDRTWMRLTCMFLGMSQRLLRLFWSRFPRWVDAVLCTCWNEEEVFVFNMET